MLGVSKNSVIGKIDRLGLKLANAVDRVPVPRSCVPKASSAPTKADVKIPAPRNPIMLDMESVFSHPQKTPLVSLRSQDCRFPLGDPREDGFGYCGATSRVGSPYCEEHRALCYTPSRKKPKTFAFGRERGRA
jgi:GcrA cell cycle regulator